MKHNRLTNLFYSLLFMWVLSASHLSQAEWIDMYNTVPSYMDIYAEEPGFVPAERRLLWYIDSGAVGKQPDDEDGSIDQQSNWVPKPSINQPKNDNACTKDPIDTATGSVFFDEARISLPAHGIPLSLSMKYQSISPRQPGSLGFNWCHSFDWILSDLHTYNGEITLSTGSGERFGFLVEEQQVYICARNNWTIQQVGDFFHLEQPAGTTYIFDPGGNLRRIEDAWGVGLTCYYDSAHQLTRVRHDNGRTIEFTPLFHEQSGQWRIGQIAVPEGVTLEFAYNDLGQISRIDEQVDEQVYPSTYLYDAMGNLTNKVTRAGYTYDYTYQSESTKGTRLSADGYYVHEVDYASFSSEVIYELASGNQYEQYQRGEDNSSVSVHYGPVRDYAELEEVGIAYDYNPAGDETLKRLFDHRTGGQFETYKEYDANHNVTNEAVAYGGAERVAQISRTYDLDWNLPLEEREPDESLTTYNYTNGAPLRISRWKSASESLDMSYVYNAQGQALYSVDAMGATNAYGYTPAGDLSEVIPPLGPRTHYSYTTNGFTQRMETLSETGASSGRVTTYAHDAHGRVIETTFADGSRAQTEYNGLGDVLREVDRAGRVTDYERVPTALKSLTRYLETEGTNLPVRTAYELDALTQVRAIIEPSGRVVESYALDAQGRATSITNIEEQVMQVVYAVGDFVEHTVRYDGSVVSNVYNEAGLLAEQLYLDEAGAQTARIERFYNADGRLNRTREGSDFFTSRYDLLNRVTYEESYIGNFMTQLSHRYNANGARIHTSIAAKPHWHAPVTFSAGRSIAYDAAGRITQKGGAYYRYSPIHGQLESVSNSVVTAHYSYDLLNQLTGITYLNTAGEPIKVLEYERDLAGMIRVKREDGVETRYTYDSLDRLTSESGARGTIHYSYDLAGNRLSTFKSGWVSHCSYGEGNRLSSMSVQPTNLVEVSGIASELLGGTDSAWGTRLMNNWVAVAELEPTIEGNRFQAWVPVVAGQSNALFTILSDEAGNMALDMQSFYVPAAEPVEKSYQYDEAGNLTARGTQDLEWDERYRLRRVAGSMTTIIYSYDVKGHKASRTDLRSSTSEHYIYDGDHIVADLDVSGQPIRTYAWGAGIDNLISFTDHSTDTTYYAVKDHLNSVIAFVDERGSMVERYEYDAFGRTQIFGPDGVERPRSYIGNRYMFQGREYDAETGLYYFRARWYDPETGRWFSKDPIGIAGGLNLYEAFGNNAVNFVDPFGFMGNRPSRPGPGSADFRKYGESGVIIASITVVVAEIKDIENEIMDELLSENPDEDLINELEKDLAELKEILEEITEASEKCME